MNITGLYRVQVSDKYRFLPQRFNWKPFFLILAYEYVADSEISQQSAASEDDLLDTDQDDQRVFSPPPRVNTPRLSSSQSVESTDEEGVAPEFTMKLPEELEALDGEPARYVEKFFF